MPANRSQNGHLAEGARLDESNRLLLAELQRDARLSLAELGRRVGLSPPAVAERIQRLERDGVIAAYAAEIDPRAVGFPLTAIIRIRPAPGQLRNVAELTPRIEEVVECDRITGEDCFIMRVHLRDVDHLEEVVDRLVPLGQTTTSIVQSSPVPKRPLRLALEEVPGGS